ncbi:MAG: hypothetical protein M3Q42_00235 [Pseudomonadota bacterium]|nr:hypothetical protein [Pseudomonadota bacterium]
MFPGPLVLKSRFREPRAVYEQGRRLGVVEMQLHERSDPHSDLMPSANWPRLLRRAAVSGTVAGVASGVMFAMLARRRTGRLASGPNATSHVLWGESAARHHEADLRHTGAGMVIHHASTVFWAIGFEWLLARRRPPPPLIAAATVATAAYVVDYHLVPKRLTPGFELHLSGRSMAGVYAALAAGLALGAMLPSR